MEDVTGWGRSHTSRLNSKAANYIPRGNAQAYNDASTLDNGAWAVAPKTAPVLDESTLNVTVGAGYSVSELLTFLGKRGRTLSVVPGSGWASIGGMLAAEVHGKNHHHVGTVASIVVSFILESPSGVKTVSRTENKDLFFATISGMGLTGLITSVTLKTSELKGTSVRVKRTKTSLDDMFDVLKKEAEAAPLGALASIDAYSKIAMIESGTVVKNAHAVDFEVVESMAPSFLRFNRLSIIAANFMRYRMNNNSGGIVSFAQWLYPLSTLPHWSRYHGRDGMWQYQFSIKDSVNSRKAILFIINAISKYATVTLTTLKYLGSGTSEGLLGFTQAGWTLAVDVKVPSNAKKREYLRALLHEFDAGLAMMGGRLYLTKDARCVPSVVERMYSELKLWRSIVDKHDPHGLVDSDLSRRVGLRKPYSYPFNNNLVVLGGNSSIAMSLTNEYESRLASEKVGLNVVNGVRKPKPNQVLFDAMDRKSFSILNNLKEDAWAKNVVVVAAGLLSDGYASKTIAEDPSWGVVEATGASYERLKAIGGGTLVVLSSGGIAVPRAGRAVYVAGKAALDSYTRGLMEISQKDNINIVLVRPSFVLTKMTSKLHAPKDAITPKQVAELTVDAIVKGGNHLVWTPRLAGIKYLVALVLPSLARKVLNKNHVEAE
jgi:decaprenylphospho-beta-D-ribofuranose 2-oxidase